jgi:E3 ubiquitin-protein ligase MYCBP2
MNCSQLIQNFISVLVCVCDKKKRFLNLLFLPFLVSIRPHAKYGLRLRNHGGRTSNGDGGTSTVKGPDGTTFTFTSCSLSFNGTNPTRGQIPQVLYFSTPQESGGNDVQVEILVQYSMGSKLFSIPTRVPN